MCTSESNVHLESFKSCCDSMDSTYLKFLQSPKGDSGLQPSSPSAELLETPKENLEVPITPREMSGGSVNRSNHKEAPAVGWCETPRLKKRSAPLRQRLLMWKPGSRSPCPTRASESVKPKDWLSASFDSLEVVSVSSELEQDLPLSVRKHCPLLAQGRTSTLINTGAPPSFDNSTSLIEFNFNGSLSASDEFYIHTPSSHKTPSSLRKENCQSPCDTTSVLKTPSFSQTPRSPYEDSGFCSLTFDKSQDSSVNHDGSFQELLHPDTRRNGDISSERRRSRLQRQNRLSTLKEGGSQSEDEPKDKKHQHSPKCPQHSNEDEVFVNDATPSHVTAAACKGLNPVGSEKHDHAPSRTTRAKSGGITPHRTELQNTSWTPLNATPANLSLTPALELVHSMCQREAHMFVGRSPSLKEKLDCVATLARTPLSLRTSMPLSGLIGRKMGLRKVDIFSELKKRNLKHILAQIFTLLDPESIYRFGQVSKGWNQMIQQDKQAILKRRSHNSEADSTPEVSSETRIHSVRRSVLKMVQARSRTSSLCTPQSAGSTLTPSQHSGSSGGSSNSSSKIDKYMEIAKTLFSDECLRPCPRCQSPARCHVVKCEGVCSRDDCSFQFCTSCYCAFHGSRECGTQSAGRRKKDALLLPGSAQSKRNIRRL